MSRHHDDDAQPRTIQENAGVTSTTAGPIRGSLREDPSKTNISDSDQRSNENKKAPVLVPGANAQSSRISLPQVAQVDDVEESPATTLDARVPWRKTQLQTLWQWKPKAARYDPNHPPKFTIWMNMLFGFVSLCYVLPPKRISKNITNPHVRRHLPLGIMLHRIQPLLQPSRPEQDRRDLRRHLRKGLVGSNLDASWLLQWVAVHLPVG